jgi:hypothetical protein
MRHAKTLVATFTAAALAALIPAAEAQVREVPAFFGGGNNAIFDPEISIVESGVKLDVQATVSADRKYVTMTARPQLASLVAIREFTFQNGGPRGIVGMPPPANPVIQNQDADPKPKAGGAKASKAPPPATAPAAPKAATPSVLEREGMFRIVLQPGR